VRAETRRVLLVLVALAFLPCAPLLAQGGPEPALLPQSRPETQKSGVRVRNADIHGQVFLASEREGQDETPAPDVIVQIRNPEDQSILRKAEPDKDGMYTFPKLDVGPYELRIGGLKLKITVVPEIQSAKELPKIIIVILPRQMAKLRPE
jgi:hypothetical protein